MAGRDGSMRSNRLLCQMAGQYAVDLFIGAGDVNRISTFTVEQYLRCDRHGRGRGPPYL